MISFTNKMEPIEIIERTTRPTDSVQTQLRGKSLSRKMLYMLIGVVTFVIVVGVVLLSVYIGIQTTSDIYKEYQVTMLGNDGAVKHEHIIVTDTEEVFITDAATGIADFSKGLLTIKLMNSGFPANKCFVTNMNFTDFQTPVELTSTHAASQITFETKHMARRTFDVTDVWLNNQALGPRSSELCKGTTVYFLLEKSGQTTRRKKRKVCIIPNSPVGEEFIYLPAVTYDNQRGDSHRLIFMSCQD